MKRLLRLGPLRVDRTAFAATYNAYGLVYATTLPLRAAQPLSQVRGFYLPTRRHLIWIYLDYS